MITITINGKLLEVDNNHTLLTIAKHHASTSLRFALSIPTLIPVIVQVAIILPLTRIVSSAKLKLKEAD